MQDLRDPARHGSISGVKGCANGIAIGSGFGELSRDLTRPQPKFNAMASDPVLGSNAGIAFGSYAFEPWSNPFSFTKFADEKAKEAHEPGSGYIH